MTQALAKTEPLPVARMSTTPMVNVQALIEKAVDAKSAVEVIKELRAMALDEEARYAKRAFDEAMTSFQSECPTITKDKAVPDRNGRTAYKYAPIEIIETNIRPILQRHGFSHTFDQDTASQPGEVIVRCIVRHTAGHERASTQKFPLGTKTGIMSDTQQYAAALTFANRRALQNAYGLVLAGEDMDGAGPREKPAASKPMTDEEKALKVELWNLLKPFGGADRTWDSRNQWMVDECVLSPEQAAPNLTVPELKAAIEKAKAKLA